MNNFIMIISVVFLIYDLNFYLDASHKKCIKKVKNAESNNTG